MSKWIKLNSDGQISTGQECPYKDICYVDRDGDCNHHGKDHEFDYSCTFARTYDAVLQWDLERENLQNKEKKTTMNIEIKRIGILRCKHGMDMVTLYTDLPPTTPPEVSNDPCQMLFYCTKDTAEQYCKDNFPGVPVTIINMAIASMYTAT